MEYFETSAKTGLMINEMMEHIMTLVYEKKFKEEMTNAPQEPV